MQGWVFGKWNFSEQRWSGAIFYRAQCRDRRRFPRIWFLNCKKSSWHLTPLSFLSWFGLFVYSKKRKASDPASQPKASQIQKVPILKRPHDISVQFNSRLSEVLKRWRRAATHLEAASKMGNIGVSGKYCPSRTVECGKSSFVRTIAGCCSVKVYSPSKMQPQMWFLL